MEKAYPSSPLQQGNAKANQNGHRDEIFAPISDEESLRIQYFQEFGTLRGYGKTTPARARAQSAPPTPGRMQELSMSTVTLRKLSKKLAWRAALGRLLDDPSSSVAAKAVLCLIICAIIVSVLTFYLSTIKSLTSHDNGATMWLLEAVCVFIFTAEFILRTVVGTLNFRVLVLRDMYYWVDLLSIIPFYAELAITSQPAACTPVVHINGTVSSICTAAELPQAIRIMQLLRLMRILKLMRHYVDMRVLTIAMESAWRALLVPVFAMLMIILVLSGALWLAEADPDNEGAFENATGALWCIFWVVVTLGFDGSMGTGGGPGQIIIGIAIMCGLVLTTMPITVMGEAFQSAWKRKELIILQIKIGELLALRNISVHEFKYVFDELDEDGSGELDWGEFKNALETLNIQLPVHKVRGLFETLDEDRQGTVGYDELCKALFPKQDWELLRLQEKAAVAMQSKFRGFLARKQTSTMEGLPLNNMASQMTRSVPTPSFFARRPMGGANARFTSAIGERPAHHIEAAPSNDRMLSLLEAQNGRIAALEKSMKRVSAIAETLLEDSAYRSAPRRADEQTMQRIFTIVEQLLEESKHRKDAEPKQGKGVRSIRDLTGRWRDKATRSAPNIDSAVLQEPSWPISTTTPKAPAGVYRAPDVAAETSTIW
jgi:voltage-gated potassium channel